MLYCSPTEICNLPMTYFVCEKMSSLEVSTPVQLQLRRVVVTKPIYTPLPIPKLEVHSDGCSAKIMPVWSPIIPNYAGT